MHADPRRHRAHHRPADREDVAPAAQLPHHRGRERSDEDGDRPPRAEGLRLTMIRVRRISHATFETPDLDQQVEHFTKVTGLVMAAREKERVLLSSKVGALVLQLRKGEHARCTKLSFQLAPSSEFGEITRFLTAQGIRSDVRSDDVPGMSKL